MIEEELAQLPGAARGRSAGPTIAALRAKASGVARARRRSRWRRWPAPTSARGRASCAMADAIANKLLHAPSTALKKHRPKAPRGST